MTKADREFVEKIRSLQIGPTGDTGRGYTVQLPKNYRHAKQFTKDGHPCWTSKQEAREIASRAQDAGEGVWFDR